jgi:hypothetical protein
MKLLIVLLGLFYAFQSIPAMSQAAPEGTVPDGIVTDKDPAPPPPDRNGPPEG